MIPNAVILPSMVWVMFSSDAYSVLVINPRLKLDDLKPPWSCNPKMRVRNGVSIASEISEKKAESIFKLKYPTTNLGYFFMYEKMIRRLFIC
jgi:hypothetical protein